MAMTTARAYSKRRKILVASGAYHGSQPWCTPNRTGIVDEDRSHVITYRYDDIGSLEAAVRAADCAAVSASVSARRCACRLLCAFTMSLDAYRYAMRCTNALPFERSGMRFQGRMPHRIQRFSESCL